MPLIPDAALDADIATIAQKGAGKTYFNRGLVERLLDENRRVVIMDPLNSWWGLKAKADGTPGYPVVVIGGANGDLPLDPGDGERLGEFVAKAHMAVVVDVSDLKRHEMISFSNAFLSALYRINRAALWLVLEEADVFAPQQPMGDATMLLHTVDQIARRGRARGFRLWSITQRPARIHKDVLSMASTLVMMRIRGPQDRAAALDWIKGNADRAEAMDVVNSLASLKVGEGWVYAPDHDLLERMTFPAIRTLDTSATPKPGETKVEVKEFARGDVEALREALKPPPAPNVPETSRKRPDGPSEAEIEAIRSRARKEGEAFGYDVGYRAAFEAVPTILRDHLQKVFGDKHVASVAVGKGQVVGVVVAGGGERKVAPPLPRKIEGKVSAAVLKIVAFYESIYPRAVPFDAAAKQAGVGMRSSQYRTYEPELLALGVVEAASDGRYRALRQVGSPDEYLDQVEAQLAPKHKAVFRFIRRAGQPVTRDEVMIAAEISPNSSTTSAALALLMKEAEVVEQVGDRYQLAEAFR